MAIFDRWCLSVVDSQWVGVEGDMGAPGVWSGVGVLFL